MSILQGEYDGIVVGAGAAGLATAIFAARAAPRLRIAALDGAAQLGAKILVSGGGRCNVTHRTVTTDDFRGGSKHTIKRVLAALPVAETIAFFADIGVPLHVEETGKLFPNSNRARTVLDALIGEARRLGVTVHTGQRVVGVEKIRGAAQPAFEVIAQHPRTNTDRPEGSGENRYRVARVVLCTGGMSLPKTGSDGAGYQLATKLGHSIVPPTQSLVPLLLEGDFHARLSGLSHDAEIVLRIANEKPIRQRGEILWTHFGLSGPCAMDASRFWTRAMHDGMPVHASVNLIPAQTQESFEQFLLAAALRQPRMHLRNAVGEILPARVVDEVLARLPIGGETPLAHLARDMRRKLTLALADWPLTIRGARGWNYAEVTAGGVPLTQVDVARMESRICPGLHLVGEILDVDGRIGGFNFQWAWSSAFVAGRALAAANST